MGLATNPFVQLVGVMLMVVLGLAFGEEIIDSAQSALSHEYAGNFTALTVIAGVIPTIYYVALLGVAGGIGFINIKGLVKSSDS